MIEKWTRPFIVFQSPTPGTRYWNGAKNRNQETGSPCPVLPVARSDPADTCPVLRLIRTHLLVGSAGGLRLLLCRFSRSRWWLRTPDHSYRPIRAMNLGFIAIACNSEWRPATTGMMEDSGAANPTRSGRVRAIRAS